MRLFFVITLSLFLMNCKTLQPSSSISGGLKGSVDACEAVSDNSAEELNKTKRRGLVDLFRTGLRTTDLFPAALASIMGAWETFQGRYALTEAAVEGWLAKHNMTNWQEVEMSALKISLEEGSFRNMTSTLAADINSRPRDEQIKLLTDISRALGSEATLTAVSRESFRTSMVLLANSDFIRALGGTQLGNSQQDAPIVALKRMIAAQMNAVSALGADLPANVVERMITDSLKHYADFDQTMRLLGDAHIDAETKAVLSEMKLGLLSTVSLLAQKQRYQFTTTNNVARDLDLPLELSLAAGGDFPAQLVKAGTAEALHKAAQDTGVSNATTRFASLANVERGKLTSISTEIANVDASFREYEASQTKRLALYANIAQNRTQSIVANKYLVTMRNSTISNRARLH